MRERSKPRRDKRQCDRRRLARMVRLTFAIGLGTASGIAATATRAASSDLPTPMLASPASPARLPGKMVFAALVTPDLVAAERFYASLFGWQFQNAYVGGRTLVGQASFDGRVIAAIVQKPLRDGQRPVWRSFLSTADVEKGVQVAVQNGASVLLGPHEIANLGQDALLADPQGAVFGMMTSSSGDPADVLAAPGEWIWSSLVTTDPEADAAFYKRVFDYDTVDLPDPQEAKHVILASQTFARASVNPFPTDHPVSHPRWISYVRVSDMAATVDRATTLGGHVVVPPHDDRNGGTIALMADPAGALFGLLAWSDDSSADDAASGDAK